MAVRKKGLLYALAYNAYRSCTQTVRKKRHNQLIILVFVFLPMYANRTQTVRKPYAKKKSFWAFAGIFSVSLRILLRRSLRIRPGPPSSPRYREPPPARPPSWCSVVLAGFAPRGTLRVHRTPPSIQRHTPCTKVPLGCQQNERTGVIGRIFAYVQNQPARVLAKESI
jgi:hypothetical protein